MEIINEHAFSGSVWDAIRAVLQAHFKTGGNQSSPDEGLLSKPELAAELGVSLVYTHRLDEKGLPFLRLHKRVYFKMREVLNAMQQNIKN